MGWGVMRLGLGMLGLALALAACRRADDRAPFADSRPPPQLAARFYAPEGWAWGYLQLGDGPVQRYGVSAPSVTPRAEVLILPDYGETAETWFETARDLNGRGYTVWVLEARGQGGSERLASPRDLGHVTSFDDDVASVRAMANAVIRPRKPLIVLGQGVGGAIAARAAETGLRADGLILSAPILDTGGQGAAGGFSLLGLGVRRAPGAEAWSRRNAFASGFTHDPWRGGVTALWQTANPDLRIGGPSVDWLSAYGDLSGRARRDLPRLTMPVMVLEGSAAKGCRGAPHCVAQAFPGGGRALELERDSVRGPWMASVVRFVAERLG